MPAYHRPSSDTDVVRLPTDPACEVRMRKEADFGLYTKAVREAFRRVPDRDADPSGWFSALYEAGCCLLIESWNLEEADGTPLPITAEELQALHRDDGDFLLALAMARLDERPAKDEAPFVNASSNSSTAMKSTRRRSLAN